MTLEALTHALGGIGLFLLGMHMMTEGLKLGAGNALQRILRDWTNSMARGIFSGAMVTALVQSSSAVTVATIGFVNAGLLNLQQAVMVTYGSNLGTTMTGWLVALLGFKVNISAFAMPLIGGGMLLSLARANRRSRHIGTALAGFGIFFIGIGALQTGFDGITQQVRLSDFANPVVNTVFYLFIGFLLTVLMQSSSGAIAIVITAAASGMAPLHAAAAAVIGANVGTCSTAVLATLQATPNARRVASAHVAFNVITAVVAVALLPVLLWLIGVLQRATGIATETGATLALFHTVFNTLGVLLLWFLTPRLVAYLQTRFVTEEENLARPQFLDKTLIATPNLALQALQLELKRATGLIQAYALDALSGTSHTPARRSALEALLAAMSRFLADIQLRIVPDELRHALPNALRALRNLRDAAMLAEAVARRELAPLPASQAEQLAAFEGSVSGMLRNLDYSDPDEAANKLRDEYRQVRQRILEPTGEGGLPANRTIALLDQLNDSQRMLKELLKAHQHCEVLADVTSRERTELSET